MSVNSRTFIFCFVLRPVGGPGLPYFQSSYPFYTSFMCIIVQLSFCPLVYLAFDTPAFPRPNIPPSSKNSSFFYNDALERKTLPSCLNSRANGGVEDTATEWGAFEHTAGIPATAASIPALGVSGALRPVSK